MNRRFIARVVMLLAVCLGAAEAGPIRLSLRDTTVVGGKTFESPVYLDSSVTGLGVTSYQIEVSYDPNLLTFVGASSDTTLAASWGAPTVFLPASNRIRIAAAGGTALAGTGKLVRLTFTTHIYQYQNYTTLSFVTAMLNEGTPHDTTRNSSITIPPAPFITVSPNTALLTRGDSLQFTVSGGRAPYSWSETNGSAASIAGTGMLHALNTGLTKVICTDSSGAIDTSGQVEIRGVKLSVKDTAKFQGQTIDLPIMASDLSGLGVVSGQFTVTFNQNLWTPTALIRSGTLLATVGLDTIAIGSGTATVSFASADTLHGSGVLVYLRMKASSQNYGSGYFDFSSILFNESLLATKQAGYLTVTQLTPLTVTPPGSQTLVAGDSLQYHVSGGLAPYTWSVSDTTRATIAANGWLKGVRSGSVNIGVHDALGATGSGGPVALYDLRLTTPDSSFIPDSIVTVPLYVTKNTPGFVSVQLKVTYYTGYNVTLLDLVNAGTLTDGWIVEKTLSTGAVQIAASGTNSITSGGVLLKLVFSVSPSTPHPSQTSITLSNVLFNEGYPSPLIDNGYIQIADRATAVVTPLSTALHAQRLGNKDSTVLTIANAGTSLLSGSMSLLGSSEFTLSSSGVSVAPGDSMHVTMMYTPTDAIADTASVSVNTNDPYHPSTVVHLTGNVLLVPAISLSSSLIDFGSVKIGSFKDTTVTISNPGGDTLRITSISAGSAIYSSGLSSVTVAPGQSKTDTLRFAPVIVGGTVSYLVLHSNISVTPDTLHVTGVGAPTTGVDSEGGIPEIFSLGQNYPNPFNPTTSVPFSVPSRSRVTIVVYDVTGREVSRLVDGEMETGNFSVQFGGGALSSGLYLCRMIAQPLGGNAAKLFVAVRKLVLVK